MASTANSEDIFGLQGLASGSIDEQADIKWLIQHFQLPYNPFPPSGISPDSPEGRPLKDEQGRDIAVVIGSFIASAYRDRMPRQGLVVVGDYGTGKSHLLRLVHNQISEQLGSGDEQALSIYVQRPRVEVQDLNREILSALGEDTVRKMLWFCIRDRLSEDISKQASALRELQSELEGPLFSQTASWGAENRTFGQVFQVANLDDYRVFFKAYDAHGWPREKLHQYFRYLLAETLETRSPVEVLDAFTTLLLAPDEKSRISWESLLALGKQRRIPLLAAPEFIKDLMHLVRLNGYVYTFLLIDEFEEVPAGYLLTKRQRADYMYTLMEMIGKIETGLGLVLAITPEAWEILTELAPPLRDRLPLVVRLGDLDAASIGQLLSVYLRRAREDANIQVADPLLPFSQNLIEHIASSMRGRTPRNVLQFAHQVIAHAVATKQDQLTPELVSTVLREYLEMKRTPESDRRRIGER